MKIKETKKIQEYVVKQDIKPTKLTGISDDQIDDHWKLYEGYVKQVNTLNQELQKLAQEGGVNSLVYADRRRRYGFEYNGMILHEYYFENLKIDHKITNKEITNKTKVEVAPKDSEPKNDALKNGALKKTIEKTWGSFDKWQEDFIATGKTRGIGWAILYMDQQTNNLTNHFISEHQNGVVTGFTPILVMDVWEHAYMVDHSASDRGKYIDAFLQNVNWPITEKRFTEKGSKS